MLIAGLIRKWQRISSGKEEPRGLWIGLLGFLVLLSTLYGMVSAVVTWARALRTNRLPAPVISVGNIVVGGSGKTPLVISLARMLAHDGQRVAVLSRGYGRSGRGTLEVSRGSGPLIPAREAGDEPFMIAQLARSARVVVSSDRAQAARYAVEKLGADVIILDDGLQQVGLSKDLDIAVVDASVPWGNGHLLPAGILREHPLGVRRADVIVVTRCDMADDMVTLRRALKALAPGAPLVETRMRPAEFWELASGKPVAFTQLAREKVMALSGIANPDSFTWLLEGMGLTLVHSLSFPDHHRYSQRDLAAAAEAARAHGADVIVTTEKDAARVGRWHLPVPVVVLGIELDVIAGADSLSRAVASVLDSGEEHGARAV